jgi:hypothetical protein
MFEGHVPEPTQDEKEQIIFDKMADWSDDKYGNKTNPTFETWVRGLTKKEFNTILKIITKK